MKLRIRSLIGAAVPLLLATSLSGAQTQDATPPPPKSADLAPPAALKPIRMPQGPEPEDALQKGIEGKVTLRIVVDAEGKVTRSEALSGPPELYEAAIASTKKWLFEPPAGAPIVQIAEVWRGHPKPCPASIADHGEVSAGGWFHSKKGNVATMADNSDFAIPAYPASQMRAGISGTVKLSVSVSREGKAKKIRVVSSVSPELDKRAVDAVRTWRFKLVSDKGGGFPDQFEVPIIFTPTCDATF